MVDVFVLFFFVCEDFLVVVLFICFVFGSNYLKVLGFGSNYLKELEVYVIGHENGVLMS